MVILRGAAIIVGRPGLIPRPLPAFQRCTRKTGARVYASCSRQSLEKDRFMDGHHASANVSSAEEEDESSEEESSSEIEETTKVITLKHVCLGAHYKELLKTGWGRAA